MAHYGTLRDYHFADNVDDIRGTTVYGPEREKLGKVDDVVFDHETGDVLYLIVDDGHGRRRLLAADHVYRSVAAENDFDVNLTRAEVESLPIFDERVMQSEERWKEYERRQAEAYKRWEKQMERRYQRGWHAAPVQHKHGSTHDITPEPEETPGATGGEPPIRSADLTPQRLAGKFPEAAPGSGKVMTSPAGTPARSETAAHTDLPLSPRWQSFQELVRGSLGELRDRCPHCGDRPRHKIA